MQNIYKLSIYFLIGIKCCFASEYSFDMSKFKYNDLNFFSTKNEIIKSLGLPDTITITDYECGFLSEGLNGDPYYQLHYKNIVFTGNDNDKYLLEMVKFENGVNLKYSESILNSKTTVDDLIKLFGESIKEFFNYQSDKSLTFLLRGETDDGIVFKLKDGYLIEIHYWSPC